MRFVYLDENNKFKSNIKYKNINVKYEVGISLISNWQIYLY